MSEGETDRLLWGLNRYYIKETESACSIFASFLCMEKRRDRNRENSQFYNNAFIEIFSDLRFIRSLLIDFIAEPWVGKINTECGTDREHQLHRDSS